MLMKKNYTNIAMLLVVGAISLLQACQKDDRFRSERKEFPDSKHGDSYEHENKFYSSTLPIGNGVVRAWVKQNKDGEPVSVGVNFSEKALQNLPSDPAQYVLLLPKNKGKNFYTHVLIDWNPQGHEPAHVYDLPHFDVHFYIIPNDQRLAIGPDDLAQFANAPASQYMPDHYLQIPGGVPQMGAHWADLLSDEFNGGVFTKTFIWGTYDGNVIFFEPMLTRDYLLSHPDDLVTLRQPQAYQRDGYYATQYKVSYSDSPKEYTVALLNLVHHDGE
jgi:hypothetical protein